MRFVNLTGLVFACVSQTAVATECVPPSQVPAFPAWVSSIQFRPASLKELSDPNPPKRPNTFGELRAKWGTQGTTIPLIAVDQPMVSHVGTLHDYAQQSQGGLIAASYRVGAWLALKPPAENSTQVEWYVRIVDESGPYTGQTPCLFVHERQGVTDLAKVKEVHGADHFGSSPVEWTFTVGQFAP